MTPEERRALQNDVDTALLRWIEAHSVLTADGEPIVWPDGRPVALDVGLALRVLAGVTVTSSSVRLSQSDFDALRSLELPKDSEGRYIPTGGIS